MSDPCCTPHASGARGHHTEFTIRLLAATSALFVLLSFARHDPVSAQGPCDIRGQWHGGVHMLVKVCVDPSDTKYHWVTIVTGETVDYQWVGAKWWGWDDTCDVHCRPNFGYTEKFSRANECYNCSYRSVGIPSGCDCGGCPGELYCNGWNVTVGRGSMIPDIPGTAGTLEVSRTDTRTGCHSHNAWFDVGQGSFTCSYPSQQCNTWSECPAS